VPEAQAQLPGGAHAGANFYPAPNGSVIVWIRSSGSTPADADAIFHVAGFC
jgi:hypothetical protein